MGRKRKNGVQWSDLPMGPLEQISKSLDTETDVLRFRAVCKSWRSSATSFKKFPFANLKLPFPFSGYKSSFQTRRGAYFRLTERTVYRVQSPNPNNPYSWLLKLETADDGKLRLVNPLNEIQIKIPPEFPKVLNTLNFRVSEVCRAYTLHYVDPSNPNDYESPYSKKVAVYADADSKSNDYIVMAIGDGNELWYIKSGDETWTMMMDKEFEWANSFHDVRYYKGQFHLVDARGAVWVLNSNFERTNAIATDSLRVASMRRLVELYDGELYMVEGVTDKDKRICKCTYDDVGCQCRFPNTLVFNTVVEVVISRLDRLKFEWVATKAVKDRVIFMGKDCSFALPSKEFRGCNGGRVFYTDDYLYFRINKEKMEDEYHECDVPGCCSCDEEFVVRRDDYVPSDDDVKSMFGGWHGHNVGVFDLKSRKIGSLLKFPAFAGVFWPRPRWFK